MKAKKQQQQGVIAILSLMAVSVVGLGIVTTMSALAASQVRDMSSATSSEQTFLAAESGMDEALYRLILYPLVDHVDLTVDDVDVEVTIEVPESGDNYRRIITSQATHHASGIVRTLQIEVATNAYGGGFDSAVQTGAGGLYMDNNSCIKGSVYSNGSFTAKNTSACAYNIYGDISIADSASGIDMVHLKKNEYDVYCACDQKCICEVGCACDVDCTSGALGIGGTAYAHTIQNSCIERDAHYYTIDAYSFNHVVGNKFPNSTDPVPLPLPFDQTKIDEWTTQIEAESGLYPLPPSGACPIGYQTGYYCIMNSMTLGHQKIDSSLYVKGDVTVTLNGNVWVTGDVIFENAGNGQIRIDGSLGPLAVAFIAGVYGGSGGYIDISNNYAINGSGNESSFVLMISSKVTNEGESPAVYASNGSASIVLAAPNGEIRVKNKGTVNASSAKKIHLEEKSSVKYNPHLASFVILSGTSISLNPIPNTWKEL